MSPPDFPTSASLSNNLSLALIESYLYDDLIIYGLIGYPTK